MWNLPQPRLCDFAIRCKGCGETIPAPVGTMPDSWIVAACPLCGTRRRYLPNRDISGSTVTQISWWAASHGGALMGEMRRAIAREEQERRTQNRFASTLVIAASIIAAVRLARGDISRPSPRLRWYDNVSNLNLCHVATSFQSGVL